MDSEQQIVMPDVGAGQLPVHVSSWLVETGEYVFEGDRIVELTLPGMTFDVHSPADGTLIRIDKSSGATVKAGEPLGQLLSPGA
jgi:pyruvate/2-oxoglutarate dehydrogenase complex dihydrolipoamide acyltransferase (E2) component